MLTADENELLTRVGPGTRMGNLLRRYWYPVAAVAEMESRWTLRVKILGEDLVLFKDRSGRLGLIAEYCPHRRASLAYGIPTDDGLRCPYHGWEYDTRGHCLDRPSENDRTALKDKAITPAYPVEELGGLIFAYLGPKPAPLLNRYDAYVEEGAIRTVGKTVVDCNWLQIMENSADPVHTEWLHGQVLEFVTGKESLALSRHHVKIAFDEFPYGIVKRRLLEGQKEEESDDWKTGHPLVFPNIVAVGNGGGLWKQYQFQIRVPMDDTHTMHYWYYAYVAPDGARVPRHLVDKVPAYFPPVKDERGEYLLQYVHVQDIMAWVTQGPIADRSIEMLGASDRGVVMLRRILKRELEKIERGEDPVAVIRDPAQNTMIELPLEKHKLMWSDGLREFLTRDTTKFSPIVDDLCEVYAQNMEPGPGSVRAPVSAK